MKKICSTTSNFIENNFLNQDPSNKKKKYNPVAISKEMKNNKPRKRKRKQKKVKTNSVPQCHKIFALFMMKSS